MPNLLGMFLRHAETHTWLTRDGRLSFDADKAYRLRSSLEAIDLCRKLQLHGMELVLRFDNAANDVAVPIAPDDSDKG